MLATIIVQKSSLTNPDEAKIFVEQTKIDALAVSIGNVHLQKRQQNNINLDLLKEIEQKTSCPLVLHGSSGVSYESRRHLALNTSICKFNIGTELRQEFGKNLRLILEKKKYIIEFNLRKKYIVFVKSSKF